MFGNRLPDRCAYPSDVQARVPEPRLGIVCAGGVLRLFSVLGAMIRLEEAGLRASVITGSSSGAFTGVMAAALGVQGALTLGRSLGRIGNRAWNQLVGPGDWARLGWSRGRGLISFRRMAGWVETITGYRRIEDLPVRTGVCVTDLETWTPRFVTRGALGPAVAASCSLPLAQPILLEDGRPCVDGGLTVNVPVRLCYELGADVVAALDGLTDPHRTSGRDALVSREEYERSRPRSSSLVPDAPPDFWLRMGAPNLPVFDFCRWEELVDLGYRAAEPLVHRLRAALCVRSLRIAG